MIITLIISLLFGGGNRDLIIPQIDKYYKKNVENKDDREALKLIFREYDTEKKAYDKAGKKRAKKFQKLQSSSNPSKQDFEALHAQSIESKLQWNQKSLKIFSSIKSHLTDIQWDESMVNIDKDIKKHRKSYKKTKDHIFEKVRKTNKRIVRILKDEKNNKEAIALIQNFEVDIVRIFSEYEEKGEISLNSMLQYSADVETIKTQEEALDTIGNHFYESYLKAYLELKELLNDEEWKKVKRAFNAVI